MGSNRKVTSYSEEINASAYKAVTGDLQYLIAKLDTLNEPNGAGYTEFREACEKIVGFPISTRPSDDGKIAGRNMGLHDMIPLRSMGEGIPNLLGLIERLCNSEGKLFLIEEPENDLHPQALKNLLDMVIRYAEKNQFLITTHSNTVVRYLGSVPKTRLFRVTLNSAHEIPKSKVDRIKDADDRVSLLEELGYELSDHYLYEGWLILEESSAEIIIRDYLIRWFVPGLISKLRTVSAGGISKIEKNFEDFLRLFVYVHLASAYVNRAWILVDAGNEEKSVVDRLHSKFSASGWGRDQFLQLCEHDFERYYPQEFNDKVAKVLAIESKQERRNHKKQLLEQVVSWIAENDERAKKAFEQSAQDVIDILRQIESALCAQ